LWIDWLPVTDKGQIPLSAWQAFQCLLQEFDKADLPVTFVSISGDADIPGSLAAQPLKFPVLSLPQSASDADDELPE
jgi:hypothetical protein